MSKRSRDAAVYRRDETLGGKLLTLQQRIELVQPYLPPVRHRSSATSETRSRFGIRSYFKNQLHFLVFYLIHVIFSLYIRFRQAFHAVSHRIYSLLYYHHRTPELIERDTKALQRLPKHLSVILSLGDGGQKGAELERLVNEAADVAAWCASAGIPVLSIYEKTGALKGFLPETHRAIHKKLGAYFGSQTPVLTLQTPHAAPIKSHPLNLRVGSNDGSAPKELSVLLISSEDSRDSIVDLTKTLAEMAQQRRISPSDVSIDLVDAELSESVMGEPDLLILFRPHVELGGYPPWQIRLTEIFHVPDSQGVGYQVFYRGLYRYAQAQMRFGK